MSEGCYRHFKAKREELDRKERERRAAIRAHMAELEALAAYMTEVLAW